MADEAMNSADLGPSKRVWGIAIVFMILILVAIIPQMFVKDWLCANPWFHSALVDGPAVIAAIIAWRELRHSAEANEHRRQMSEELSGAKRELGGLKGEATRAGEYLRQRNELEQQNMALREKLNASTQEIANNLKRPLTKAERNAATLNKYMRKMASVSQEGQTNSPIVYEIVDVNEDNVLTLFSTPGTNATGAYYNKVDCEDLAIDERPHGSCPVRIHVMKYQGQAVQLGQCGRWEDSHVAASAAPSIDKAAAAAWSASYVKAGSSETRRVSIFQAKDGSNRFQLETSQGLVFVGDNVQVSKNFMLTHVEWLAENFTRGGSGTGATQGGFRLFVC